MSTILAERATAAAAPIVADRLVERAGRERQVAETPNRIEREPGQIRQLFIGAFASERLTQHLGATEHARVIARPIGGETHHVTRPGNRRRQRLTDPPHGVADEVDTHIRIVLLGGMEQPGVRLAHEIFEGDATMLVAFGDGKSKAQIRARQCHTRLFTLGARAFGVAHDARQLFLDVRRQRRRSAQIIDVQVEQLHIAAQLTPALRRGNRNLLNFLLRPTAHVHSSIFQTLRTIGGGVNHAPAATPRVSLRSVCVAPAEAAPLTLPPTFLHIPSSRRHDTGNTRRCPLPRSIAPADASSRR